MGAWVEAGPKGPCKDFGLLLWVGEGVRGRRDTVWPKLLWDHVNCGVEVGGPREKRSEQLEMIAGIQSAEGSTLD